jgi:PAS domain S-box-containing protein
MDLRNRFWLTLGAMVVLAIAVEAGALFYLYNDACNKERRRLEQTAQNRALWLESAFDRLQKDKALINASARMNEVFGNAAWGKTGEFLLARRKGDKIVFVLIGKPHQGEILPKSDRGRPTKRSLEGQSGTLTGKDYRGMTVLAAYHHVPSLGWGVVAKIDLKEIRAPFLWAGLVAGLAVLLVVVFGVVLFHLVARPLIQKLQEESHLHRQLGLRVIDSVNQGILITDLEARIQYVNTFLVRVTGYEASELLGQNPRVLKSGEHGQEFYEQMWRSLVNTGSWQGEIWNKAKDGSLLPEWLNISTVYNARGKPVNYVAIFSDLTQYKRRQMQKDMEVEGNFYQTVPDAPSVTSTMLGLESLKEGSPETFAELVAEYQKIIEHSLEEQAYHTEKKKKNEVKRLAQKISGLNGGPRDVIDIYSSAIRGSAIEQYSPKAQKWFEEGRIVLIETLGQLVSIYQRGRGLANKSKPEESERKDNERT